MKTLKSLFWLGISMLLAVPLQAQKLDMNKLSGLQPRSIGPSGMSGRVTAIDVVASDPNTIYVGAASGGLWKTESGGLEWTPIFDDQAVTSIGSICIYQANPDIIWVGTGEGNPRNSVTSGYGIYRSLDAGKTWKLMGLEKTRNIYRVIIDPTNPDIVYAGAIGSPWGPHPERGVYKTTDGGKTWKQILFTNEQSGCADLIMDPNNPDKLFAAMWEHRRWPWFFKSGGPGSGLYVTWDGGQNWKKLTEKEGLPKGELGRIGLAISAANSKRIYAWVESKKNAIYRSDDGGFNWRKMTEDNIGGRPFYYCDLYADPSDPDRVYTLYSRVNKSEDGGAHFSSFMRGGIHPDHHAWYIHPTNSNFMIDGNDGGLAITHDRGATWRFVTNLPLAQFYHINYDLEFPYHVYGGLQDNGSWYGPAYSFKRGGIQFYDWQTLMGGDGFDVVPDSSNNRYGYAMSQGGSVGRYDKLTGATVSIRPVHPEGKDLRFNWNAAIAHDPLNKTTIYFGSQFVHKSTDRGDSWEIISPDLTTNNPEKLKQDSSGGLTFDVTGAENHCTIITISPSPMNQKVIWVGTDDGNLQLTTDGGTTWTNLIGKIKGAPENGWIPSIHVSNHVEGEAFVVINNYRQNDFAPYLFHTTNFGKTWDRLVNDQSVWGYCLSVIQDPVEPDLVFLGTEYGLYVSIDHGKSWTKWTVKYPTASTMDLKIHPREHDLIIGTFGRAVYILDDIRPLRELAAKGPAVLDEPIHAFAVPEAFRMSTRSQSGVYGGGSGYFSGRNRPSGAILTYSVKEPIKAHKKSGPPANNDQMSAQRARMMARMRAMGMGGQFGMMNENRKYEPVKINIYNANGKKIRSLQSYPKAGINRTTWGLDEEIKTPGAAKSQSESSGSRGYRQRGNTISALPGRYKAVFYYGGQKDSTMITVDIDPRIPYRMEDLVARRTMAIEFLKKVHLMNEASTRLKQAKASLDLIEKQIPKGRSDSIKELRSKTKAIKDTLQAIMDELSPPQPKNVQGMFDRKPGIQSKVQSASWSLGRGYGPVTGTQKTQVKLAEKELRKFLVKVDAFFTGPWPAYKSFIKQSALTPFTGKPYKKLEW